MAFASRLRSHHLTRLLKPRRPHALRCIHSTTPQDLSQPENSDWQAKYASKLRQRAERQGISLEELKRRADEERAKLAAMRKKKLDDELALRAQTKASTTPQSTNTAGPSHPRTPSERKDGSPVRPLSSILNLPLIVSTPHTADQISALWHTYHASRSGGTGRGYVCATVPVGMYEKMLTVSTKYPNFVIPLPRGLVPPPPGTDSTGEERMTYEFFFMQWGFHGSPIIPTPSVYPTDIFVAKPNTTSSSAQSSPNPHTSTLLFTSLQEYKLHQSFATPYFVLTHYTDFAQSHGIVLLRGEITPRSGSPGNAKDPNAASFYLTQEDAQMLAIGVQKYFLWGEVKKDGKEDDEGQQLLKTFHETPEQFDWERLLKFSNL